jgi:hypothetical protein
LPALATYGLPLLAGVLAAETLWAVGLWWDAGSARRGSERTPPVPAPPTGSENGLVTPRARSGAPVLEGTYRRRYDDGVTGVGRADYITFTTDGRFEERGFQYHARGAEFVGNNYIVFDKDTEGRGTYRVLASGLELTYATNKTVLISYSARGTGTQTELILNGHAFVRNR